MGLTPPKTDDPKSEEYHTFLELHEKAGALKHTKYERK